MKPLNQPIEIYSKSFLLGLYLAAIAEPALATTRKNGDRQPQANNGLSQ